MIQLNPRLTGGISREFTYDLPSFLAKDGDCFLKVEVKPLSECVAAMKPVQERLVAQVKSSTIAMNKRLDASVSGVRDDPFDIENPTVARAFEQLAGTDTKFQQKFLRSLLMGCHDNCIMSWGTNIYDNQTGAVIESTRENFEALVRLAYPDSGLPDVGELTSALSDLRNDIITGTAEENAADAEAREEEVKNS